MVAKLVQHSAVVIALLVLGTIASGAVAQVYYDRKMLLDLFETALLNDNDALWTLQEIFFDPNSKQSPEKVWLLASISVEDIADPESDYCERVRFVAGSAFVRGYDNTSGIWVFNSYYELHQQVDDASDTQELANLIASLGSTNMFYSFDPSFYAIVKTLSSSQAYAYDDNYYHSNGYAYINITINTELVENPCWDDAVYAMRSVLMWVSLSKLSTK